MGDGPGAEMPGSALAALPGLSLGWAQCFWKCCKDDGRPEMIIQRVKHLQMLSSPTWFPWSSTQRAIGLIN